MVSVLPEFIRVKGDVRRKKMTRVETWGLSLCRMFREEFTTVKLRSLKGSPASRRQAERRVGDNSEAGVCLEYRPLRLEMD